MSASKNPPAPPDGPAPRDQLYRLHNLVCSVLIDRLEDEDRKVRASVLAVACSYLNNCGISEEVRNSHQARESLERISKESTWSLENLQLPIGMDDTPNLDPAAAAPSTKKRH